MKVLIADDDSEVLDITAYALRRHGFAVSAVSDGRKALAVWEQEQPDLVLLDVRMPKLNGFEVLRTIRQTADTPVIMLTARGDDEDVVFGLELGADDYITKPFSTRQLAARMRAVLRRNRQAFAEPAAEIEAGGMRLDTESHEMKRGDLRVRMTRLEFRIVYPLMLNAGRVVPSNRLVEQAWGFEGGDSYMLKTHISHIRKRLQLRRGEPGYIEAIPGVGYIMHR
ncbi:MAG TPA: response regulator transcription factor [Chloroflexota bacterium]|nr:response regulator transcription factor [Chloroflexota bacterium]